jgi:CelD/BcsL family acetyltransferase involved in cellulose biosynthesis
LAKDEGHFDLITTDERFDELEEDWIQLHSNSTADSLFCSYPWMRAWWRFYNNLGELRILTLRRNQKLVGVAPFFLRRMSARDIEVEMVGERRFIVPTQGLRYKVLQLLGSGQVCSDFLGFIAHEDDVDLIWTELYSHLQRHIKGYDILHMANIDEDTRGFKGLQYAAMRVRNARYSNQYKAPYAALPGTYDDYLYTLSKKSRYNARKKIKQIAVHHDLKHAFHKDPETLDAAMDLFYNLHLQRWKAEGQDGVFTTAPMRDFHKAMAAEGLRRGWLRLGFLSLDDKPVFCTYGYQVGASAYLYQQGGSPEYPNFNLGYAALAFSIEDACENGAGGYDFLRGEQGYKLHWAKNSRQLVQFIAGRSLKSMHFFARSFFNTDPQFRSFIKRFID